MYETKAREREISDGLLRQRRNFMIFSLILPLFYWTGASVEKINILGTVIELDNPKYIKFAVASLFAYFFLRYWQYYREETYVIEMKRRIKEHIYSLERKHLVKMVRQKIPGVDISLYDIYFLDPSHREGGKTRWLENRKDEIVFPFRKRTYFGVTHSVEKDIAAQNQFYVDFGNAGLTGFIPTRKTETPSFNDMEYYISDIIYIPLHFWMLRVLGWCRYMITESYFTDYQFPFVIGLGSIAITLTAIFI
ncbi:hypothetical protein FHO46_17600 [Vibrio cholerae]|uniref:hypothetical protein n=1 Tax=Vibrio cholerae TaxID=666 RepID=UPI0011D2FAA2|nr:hypothetical protein [Vibrio cholerae]EGR0366539.1 hypothetical protein [Vibrio cholerae]EGR0939447.1 hypothetical protein [Vibrio cholerae]EIA0770103.1 hypothetical protein [Vibrio cholerae]EJR0943150.1 hypothetical protein [Vibrio cholerae]EKF9865110.1 hypothetical protein [Vibrio cholerae]